MDVVNLMINWLDDWCSFKMQFIFIGKASYIVDVDFSFVYKIEEGNKCNFKKQKKIAIPICCYKQTEGIETI